MSAKRFIVLHHSDYSSPEPQFLAINDWHRFRGFPRGSLGWHVGYQYVVEKDGAVRQARTEDEEGAHTFSTNPHFPDLNHTGVGVCLAGDFTRDNPADAQIASLRTLVKAIQQRHGIPDENILLHREVKATACPGVDLREMILARAEEDLRRMLRIAELALPRVPPRRKVLLRRLAARLRRLLADVS